MSKSLEKPPMLSVRLTSDDEELLEFIDNTKGKNRSEKVRNMLHYAMEQKQKELYESKEFEEIKNQLQEMRLLQEEMQEKLLTKMNNIKISAVHGVEEEEPDDIVDESTIANSATAMLNSFGGW